MEFKAIALDMDGTLLNEDNALDEDLAAFLQHIRTEGVKVFLASGRSRVEIEEVLPTDFVYDGMVSGNGMGVYAGDEKLAQHTVDPAIIEQTVAAAREIHMYYELHPLVGPRFALAEDQEMLASETRGEKPDTVFDHEWHSRIEAIEEVIEWKETLDTDDIIKLYFFSESQVRLADWMEKLEALKQQHRFSTSSSSAHNVEIMTAGVDKGTGIELLLERYGIDAGDMMAVGDAENDLPMFAIAGLAVAMDNAQHLVKAEADDMTDLPHDEGGLLDYLEEHFDM